MNYTTIEQSKKLLELGLSPETADMLWEQHFFEIPYVTVKPYTTKGRSIGSHILPCWSLEALLELLRSYNDCNSLSIFSNRSQKWQITISYYDVIWKDHEEININLLEASYNTVIWLLENGYIKTEQK